MWLRLTRSDNRRFAAYTATVLAEEKTIDTWYWFRDELENLFDVFTDLIRRHAVARPPLFFTNQLSQNMSKKLVKENPSTPPAVAFRLLFVL